ncbi:hypothetical protein [Bacillus coahuilensis]|uniref:hypothetical protein n=1 Tax=Bacillus coahuilensis TaxID=408580 RepID=UPI0012DEE158|nr:hypothetical protein [Bacillus coahuilensis]
MSNSMLSFYFLQFMVSLITTISASFLAFSMISPIQSKGATSSAPLPEIIIPSGISDF